MARLFFSVFFGVFGIVPFILGGASSNGGILSAFVVPALALEFVAPWIGLDMDGAQLNRMAVLAQFTVYFLVAYCIMTIRNMIKSKHSNAVKDDVVKVTRS